jgi:hypothetical protein
MVSSCLVRHVRVLESRDNPPAAQPHPSGAIDGHVATLVTFSFLFCDVREVKRLGGGHNCPAGPSFYRVPALDTSQTSSCLTCVVVHPHTYSYNTQLVPALENIVIIYTTLLLLLLLSLWSSHNCITVTPNIFVLTS